jgi:hypothetical protein
LTFNIRDSLPELIAALSERISKVESQISSDPFAIIVDLKESILPHFEQKLMT